MSSISQSVAQFNPHAGGLRDDTTGFFPGADAVTRGGETPADEFLDEIIGRRAGLRLTFSQLKRWPNNAEKRDMHSAAGLRISTPLIQLPPD